MLIRDFFKKYWWRYLLGIIFLITVDIIQIYIPRQVGQIVDMLEVPVNTVSEIRLLAIGIILFAGGLALGRFFWRICIVGAARLFEFKTINKMYKHIINLDQNFYDRWRTGDLMTRFTSDTQMLMRLMGFAVIMLVDAIFMTAITVYAMGSYVNWKLTFYAILPLPTIAFMSLFFGRIIHKRFREVQESVSELSNVTEESLSGIDVTKVFSNQKTMLKLFNKKSKLFYNANIRLIRIWGLMFPMVSFLGALSTLILFWVGGRMVIMSEITLGDFIMTNQYIGMLIWPMMAFGQLVNMLQTGRASHKRIINVLKQKPLSEEPEQKEEDINYDFKGNYKIKNLTYHYPSNERIVLREVSLDIEQGQMLAFVGKVGSGKSTVAKLLAKLYPVEKENIFLDGKEINEWNGRFIRENVSYVPQDNFLFSMTIRENIAFSNKDLHDEAENYAKMANVHEDIMNFPQKYETIVGQRGVTLSGGQRQRTTIARALAKRANMIILDDCLSAVDTETEEAIIKNLREETKGKTILVISHRLKAVKEADQIFVFDDGQIVERGKHEELLIKQGIYQSMYMKQLIEEKLEEE